MTLGGAAQAGNNVTVSAGGNVAGSGDLAAAKALNVSAGKSVNLGGNLNAANIAVTAQGTGGTGDLTLGGNVSSPNTIQLNAARDASIAGPLTTGGDLRLTAGRDIAIGGAVQSTGHRYSARPAISMSPVPVPSRRARRQPRRLAATWVWTGRFPPAAISGSMPWTVRWHPRVAHFRWRHHGYGWRCQWGHRSGGKVSAPGSVTLAAARNATVGGQLVTGTDLTIGPSRMLPLRGGPERGRDDAHGWPGHRHREHRRRHCGDHDNGGRRPSSPPLGQYGLGWRHPADRDGVLATAGTVLAGGNVSASGQGGVALGGTVYATRGVTAQSGGGAIGVTGSVIAHGGSAVLTGTDVTVSGTTQSSGIRR